MAIRLAAREPQPATAQWVADRLRWLTRRLQWRQRKSDCERFGPAHGVFHDQRRAKGSGLSTWSVTIIVPCSRVSTTRELCLTFSQVGVAGAS